MVALVQTAWCAFHKAREKNREARWVIEVITPDGAMFQRLGSCDRHAKEVFRLMRLEPPQASANQSYSTIRRYMPSDAVLVFDELATD